MSEPTHDPAAPDKICSACGNRKQIKEFSRCRRNRDGLKSYCKECDRKKNRLWYEKNVVKARELMRLWYQKNADKKRKTDRLWYQKNADKKRKTDRLWYQKNADKARDRMRLWKQKNKDKTILYAMRRRAAKRGAVIGKFSQADKLEIFEMQRYRCAYYFHCRSSLRGKKSKIHFDHIVPLARGGSHDRKNMQATCDTCNLKKGAKDPIEFARELGQLI